MQFPGILYPRNLNVSLRLRGRWAFFNFAFSVSFILSPALLGMKPINLHRIHKVHFYFKLHSIHENIAENLNILISSNWPTGVIISLDGIGIFVNGRSRAKHSLILHITLIILADPNSSLPLHDDRCHHCHLLCLLLPMHRASGKGNLFTNLMHPLFRNAL